MYIYTYAWMHSTNAAGADRKIDQIVKPSVGMSQPAVCKVEWPECGTAVNPAA
jgi:hypothetical protein